VAAARAARQQPGYVAEALKALIQTQVPVKEIHIASGEPLNYRSPEGYRILNEARVVGDEDIHQLMHFAADGRYDPLRRMQEAKQYDEALTCLDHRLRCNFYKESGRLAASIRCLPSSPWAYESLGGPMQLTHVVDRYTSGLILVTGPMGSGKSSTLAALLSHINRNRSCHILTLEDPIEYVLKSDRSRISQRQIGIDVASFADGLLGAKRQHADVILVGELRDTATVKTALQAAEAGSLVFASTHSDNAAGTIEALLKLLPAGGAGAGEGDTRLDFARDTQPEAALERRSKALCTRLRILASESRTRAQSARQQAGYDPSADARRFRPIGWNHVSQRQPEEPGGWAADRHGGCGECRVREGAACGVFWVGGGSVLIRNSSE